MSGSAFNYNVASGAFLPNQGMSFEGTQSRRVYDWKSFRERAGAAQPVATAPSAQASSTAAPVPPTGTVPRAIGLGAVNDAALNKSTNLLRPNTIPGAAFPGGAFPSGALPPGSIDQNQFKAMLASASLGMNSSPDAGPAIGPAPGTAGFASPMAGGRQPVTPMPAITGRSPLAPAGILAAQQQADMTPSAGPVTGASGAAPDGIPTLTAAQFAALTGAPMAAAPMATGPVNNPADKAAVGAAANPAVAIPPVVIPAEDAATDGIPANALTMSDASIPPDGPAKPTNDDKDDGVLKLTRIPDRETRQEYAAKGIKWKLVDDPEADKLFFGEDGKFGWDDLVDLINPLQHIPGVNAIYRELTGDEIHGAAELLGAIPFGPFSTLGAVVNIAVKSITGRDIGGNVLAMIMGEDDKTSAADLAARGGTKPADMVAASDHPAMEQTAASRMIWHNGRGRGNEADA
ncbi:MAG: hypothetical protein E6Q98_01150 [Rhodospirillaceae bacterium]|nr:MAG: hypothetical protein E6Q98_01150 [Rhodospirillaceae bacterium]